MRLGIGDRSDAIGDSANLDPTLSDPTRATDPDLDPTLSDLVIFVRPVVGSEQAGTPSSMGDDTRHPPATVHYEY